MMAGTSRRPVRSVMDDGVEMAEEEQPARPGPGQPADEVGRMVRRGALDPLDRRLGGHERGCERHALLGAVYVTGRRGHRHERLELALDHSSGAWKW